MRYLLYYAGFNNVTKEEQIGVTESSDFINWKYLDNNPIIPLKKQGIIDESQTSNPCVLKQGEVYKMWYQGKSKDGTVGICYCESNDGLNWGKSEPILLINQYSGSGYREGFHHPHVVYDDSRKIFQMWYVVYKKNSVVFSYTESSNGINWNETKDTNIACSDENIKYWYPFVIKENDLFRIWFTERDKNKNWFIHHASSKDGIIWDFDPKKPVIKKISLGLVSIALEFVAKFFNIYLELPIYGIGSPFVWKEDERYYLIGHEVGPRGKLYITRYSSFDGVKWSKITNNILNKPSSKWNKFFQADPFLYVQK